MTEQSQPVATVTSQSEQVALGPQGTAEAGVRVYFTTAKGVKGSVWLSKAQFNEGAVQDAIREQAGLLDRIQGASVY